MGKKMYWGDKLLILALASFLFAIMFLGIYIIVEEKLFYVKRADLANKLCQDMGYDFYDNYVPVFGKAEVAGLRCKYVQKLNTDKINLTFGGGV